MSANKMLTPKPAAANTKLPAASTGFQISPHLAEQLGLLSPAAEVVFLLLLVLFLFNFQSFRSNWFCKTLELYYWVNIFLICN